MSGKDDKKVTVDTGGTTAAASDVPVQYQAAQKAGTVDKYTWQDNCDTTTGRVAMPILTPAPCVPKFTRRQRRRDRRASVTADTIRIGYYIAKPDPQQDALLQGSGRVRPAREGRSDVQGLRRRSSQSLYELYGRKIELVKIQGTGARDRRGRGQGRRRQGGEAATRVRGHRRTGPGQELLGGARGEPGALHRDVHHRRSRSSSIQEHSPYIWPIGPSPDQTSRDARRVHQEAARRASPRIYAGDPAFKTKKRTFALLSYDTHDGQYKESWDDMVKQLKDAGIPLVLHKNYFLDITQDPADRARHRGRVEAGERDQRDLHRRSDHAAVLHASKRRLQNYFPEWIMAGTVLRRHERVRAARSTRSSGRTRSGCNSPRRASPQDEEPGVHRAPVVLRNAAAERQQLRGYVRATWSCCSTGCRPRARSSRRTTSAPACTRSPPQDDATSTIDTVTTYGDHGFWPTEDPAGLDNVGLLWWNPKAHGEDETGAVGDGMYELVDGGRRYLSGQWPTEPLPLFDTKGAVTIYDNPPPQLTPKQYPSPAGSPAAKG